MVIFWLQVAGDPAQRRWAWEVISPALRGRLAREWTSAVSHPLGDGDVRVADRDAPARVQAAFDDWISDRWGAMPCVRHPEDWAISRRPRVIGPDHELVLVLSAPSSSTRRGRVPGYAFDLVLDRSWRIEEIAESTVLVR